VGEGQVGRGDTWDGAGATKSRQGLRRAGDAAAGGMGMGDGGQARR
jgi:hypothetical protein